MCYKLVELYSSCRCLYYQHSVDRCGKHLDPSHTTTHRIILVGYACAAHASVVAVAKELDFEFAYFSKAAVLSHGGSFVSRNSDIAQPTLSSEPSLTPMLDVTKLERKLYQTSPLKDGQFRLLLIWPSQDQNAEIKITMCRASIHGGARYDALSYRWEGSVNNYYISVNGMSLPVMANLFYALKTMRNLSGAGGNPIVQHLWVDSICIDQASVEERTKQVSLMGQIYSKAATVRVWIGQAESTNVGAAFDLIYDSVEMADRWRDKEQWQSAKVAAGNRVGVKSLTDLLNRSYWNRMWVFQEVVLAKKAIIHCGAHSISWDRFRRFDEVSASQGAWNSAENQHQEILDLRKAMFGIAHLFVSRAQATHTRNVLQPTRRLQCQDPKDKLYALLGVCDNLSKTIQPDYALSTRDVYIAFSKGRIHADGDLSSLVTAGLWTPAHGDDIGLPSWVPDLRSMEGVDLRYLAGTTLERFNATEPNYSEVNFLDEDSHCILETRAVLVDVLLVRQDLARTRDEGWRRLVNKFCRMGEDSPLSLPKLRSLFRAMVFEDASFFGQAHDSLIDREIARGIWKAITGDIIDQGFAATQKDHVKIIQERALTGLILGFHEELQRHFSHEMGRLMEFLDMFQDIGVNLRDRLLQDSLDPDDIHLHWLEFLARTDETTDKGNSAIFSTQHGRIGTGPRNVRPGDYIALFGGCRVPLILRQDGCYFRLVGPCYVAGLMQGEAWPEKEGHNGFRLKAVQII